MSDLKAELGLDAAKQDRSGVEALVSRLSDRPLLLNPRQTQGFIACVQGMISHPKLTDLLERQNGAVYAGDDDDFWGEGDSFVARYRPYKVTTDGTLQVPVFGALLNRFDWQFGRYATGYTYIRKCIERGLQDHRVERIALVIDSPGGEAAGNFELCDFIFDSRGEKSIKSFVSDLALSGGFSIATCGTEIAVARSGETGSVGVVTMHIDYSQALAQRGMKVTFVYAGDHKVDGNPYEPLGEAVKADIQARIDKTYAVFTATVARNRGMEESAVRETQARTYDAEDSVKVGFADRIGETEDELVAFGSEAEEDGKQMTGKTDDNTKAQVDAARAEGKTEGVAEGTAAGVASERARYAAVMGSEEYKGREAQAAEMLASTDLAADSIIGILSKAPKVEAAAPGKGGNAFKNAMDKSGGAGVSADPDGGEDDEDEDDGAVSRRMIQSYAAAGGTPHSGSFQKKN